MSIPKKNVTTGLMMAAPIAIPAAIKGSPPSINRCSIIVGKRTKRSYIRK